MPRSTLDLKESKDLWRTCDPELTLEVSWRPLTSGLASLVVDVQSAALVHTGDHLVLGTVEPVNSDHARLLLGVGVV